MIVIVNNNESQFEARHITIKLSEEVEIRIKVNRFKEVEIQKTQYGAGDGCLIIKPNVSNEVRIS